MKAGMSFDHGIIGESAAMRALGRQIRTAASCDLTVLVSGESGTGKELVARAIHFQSGRSKKPFVSLNCGALTETLLESELFGYERGAFTGAHQKRKGLFDAAHTGTLFLDEIAEMSTGCQVKLLRVLQESAFRAVGSYTETSVDVRVIAATNRDLAQEMTVARFREDLYYRIAVLAISTPPLRNRPSDVPILVEHFLRDAQSRIKRRGQHKVDEDAITALLTYTWPGNVRQLRHVIERLVATVPDGAIITSDDIYKALPAAQVTNNFSQVPTVFRDTDSLDDYLDRTMLGLYDQLCTKTGSHSETARLLRTNRVSLYQRIERARQRMHRQGVY
jgi:transcriptional regulator with PAS, ATPase and Fis domain